MDIKQMTELMSQNGISCPKGFVNVERDGCIAEYETLVKQNLEAIDVMLRYGVNNSFSGALKDSISDLCNLTVDVCKEKKPKKYAKMTAKADKIKREAEKAMKNKGNDNGINIVNEVCKYVDTYINAADVLLEQAGEGAKAVALRASIAKMKELRKALGEVADVSTTTALEYAKKVIGELHVWAAEAANQMTDERDLAVLDKALKYAAEWKKVNVGVQKGLFGKSNKVKDLKDIAFNPNAEELCKIAASRDIRKDINLFAENLEAYKKDVQNSILSTEADEKEIADLKKRKAELEAEKQAIIVKYQNGEISKMDAFEECKYIDEQVGDISVDIQDLQDDLDIKRQDRRTSDALFRNIENINKTILKYKNDPAMLAYIGKNLNFTALNNVMHGICTQEELEYVLDIQADLDVIEAEARRRKDEINATLRGMKDKRITAIKEGRREARRARAENGPTEQEADDYFANVNKPKIGNQPIPNENPQETNPTESNVNDDIRIVLGPDDK